jgi:hypothetical protein
MSFTVHFGAGAASSIEGPHISLQATLSSASAGTSEVAVVPHHPITCRGELRFDGDGQLSCEHATVPPGELRTQVCIDHSIAMLLVELAQAL